MKSRKKSYVNFRLQTQRWFRTDLNEKQLPQVHRKTRVFRTENWSYHVAALSKDCCDSWGNEPTACPLLMPNGGRAHVSPGGRLPLARDGSLTQSWSFLLCRMEKWSKPDHPYTPLPPHLPNGYAVKCVSVWLLLRKCVTAGRYEEICTGQMWWGSTLIQVLSIASGVKTNEQHFPFCHTTEKVYGQTKYFSTSLGLV